MALVMALPLLLTFAAATPRIEHVEAIGLNRTGSGCSCQASGACANIPGDHQYYLTSFDGSSCSCGSCHMHGKYFTADRARYGCGTKLHMCHGCTGKVGDGCKCLIASVVDYGPACFVEKDAGRPVLDASPAVCEYLTGHSSCGWSDHFSIHVLPSMDDSRPLGPYLPTTDDLINLFRHGGDSHTGVDSGSTLSKQEEPLSPVVSSSLFAHEPPVATLTEVAAMNEETEPTSYPPLTYPLTSSINESTPLACQPRADVIARGKGQAHGQYCECICGSHLPGYRCDCSGLVAYAWKRAKPGFVTQTMEGNYCYKIGWSEAHGGDAILKPSEHVELLIGWSGSNPITAACHSVAEGCSVKTQSRSYFEGNGFFPCRPHEAWVCPHAAQDSAAPTTGPESYNEEAAVQFIAPDSSDVKQ